MYKFNATLLMIAGADHPATVAYNPFDDTATVEFKTGERADPWPPWRDVKLFLHAEIDPPNSREPSTQVRRNLTCLALEAAGWTVEQF